MLKMMLMTRCWRDGGKNEDGGGDGDDDGNEEYDDNNHNCDDPDSGN